MGIEIQILDWIQNFRSPAGDILMSAITSLGNAGVVWILLSAVLLIIPQTRKTGAALAAALILDVILCNGIIKNAVARMRPYDRNPVVELLIHKPGDYSFPSGHTAASFASAFALYFGGEFVETGAGVSGADCIFQTVPVCTLSDRCAWRSSIGNPMRIFWKSDCSEILER